jgi:hypothetical protein
VFVEARGDLPDMFDLTKEPLDEIALMTDRLFCEPI